MVLFFYFHSISLKFVSIIRIETLFFFIPGSSTASTAPSTTASPVACVNCTTEAGKACQFPFIVNGQSFSTCTKAGDNRAWCSTKVDQNNNHISGEEITSSTITTFGLQ